MDFQAGQTLGPIPLLGIGGVLSVRREIVYDWMITTTD